MALVFSSAFMFQALSEEYLNQRGLMVSMIAFVSPRCHHHQCPNERVPLTPHPLHGNLKMLPLIRDMFCQEQELTFRSRFEEILKIIFVYIFVICFGHVHCLLRPLATFLSEPSFDGSSMNNFSAKWSFERSCCLANEAGGDVQWNFGKMLFV